MATLKTLNRTTHLAIALIGVGGLTLGAVSSAEAANLVKNGGFEIGNLSEWNPVVVDDPNTKEDDDNGDLLGATPDTDYVRSGRYGAFLGPAFSPGSISQVLPTKAGQQYQLSYFLKNVQASDPPALENVFQALVNGVPLFSAADLPLQEAYSLNPYTFTFTATSSSTELKFAFRNNPNFFALDDVSVNEIPTPALLPGLIALGFKLWRKRNEQTVEEDASGKPEDSEMRES